MVNFDMRSPQKKKIVSSSSMYEYGGPGVRGAAVLFGVVVGPPETGFEQQHG